MADISRETFVESLHDALNHLYNNDLLRKSPLAEWFGLTNRFDISTALRKTISEAIDGLKPPPSEPDTSKSWRTYESLYCCFVQQLNQQVVADQLCISPRQLRREQRNAIEELADALWRKFNLGGEDAFAEPKVEPRTAGGETRGEAESLIGELSWLMEAQPVKPERLAEEVQAAFSVVQPLAEKERVALRSIVGGDMPGLAIHSAALNQILISLLSLAIVEAAPGSGEAPEGLVQVAARKLPLSVETILDTGAARRAPGAVQRGAASEEQMSLKIAGELARLCGGKLYTGEPGGAGIFPIRLILPALEQFPVLVVDDNEDSLQLVKRYAAGTRYNVVCTRETDSILSLVESIRPRIIVLDIMMPKENGWIVLGRLRQHPLTADLPVIISTILPQEKLALSLGASAFLKKPVTRQSLLRALDQQFALLEPEFR